MDIENKTKKYKTSNTTIHSCQYHIIFCTKYRRRILESPISDKLKKMILEKQKDYNYEVLEMEIMPDHVHLLLDINPKFGIYNIVNHIKGYTSRNLRLVFPELKTRIPSLWTRTKFISTCGSVSLEIVKKYIEDQKRKQ
jgi:putative transposase